LAVAPIEAAREAQVGRGAVAVLHEVDGELEELAAVVELDALVAQHLEVGHGGGERGLRSWTFRVHSARSDVMRSTRAIRSRRPAAPKDEVRIGSMVGGTRGARMSFA